MDDPMRDPEAPAPADGSRPRCPLCRGVEGHSPRVCATRLARALEHSERERKVATDTVAWLRKRLGEAHAT